MSNDFHAADLLDRSFSAYSVFPFSGTSINFYSPFALNDVFLKNELGEYRVNFGDLANVAANTNTIVSELNATLFHFSGSAEKRNFSFGIEDQALGGISFQKNILQLIHLGNAAFVGEKVSMKVPVKAIHYRSFYYSWATKVSKKLQLGYTAKIYFGKSFLKMNSNFTGLTSESLSEIVFHVEGKGKVSFPVILDQVIKGTSEKFNWMRYLFEVRNPGVGINFSLNYQINPLVEIKAGINNLGLILWTSNTTNFSADNNLAWQGIDLSGRVDLSEMSDIRNNETLTDFQNSLNRLLVPHESAFISATPSSVYGSFNYRATPRVDFSVFLSGQLMNTMFRTNLMFLSAYSISPKFKITSGLSMTNRSYLNFPFGVNIVLNDFDLSLSSNDLIGILASGYSKNFGGRVHLKYRINKNRKAAKNYKKINSKTPFYQPLKRPLIPGRLF